MTAGMVRRGLSPTTARGARTTLRMILRDAERHGLVARNVAALARPPRVTCHELRVLSADETRQLLDGTVDDDLEDRRGRPARLVLGEPLPEELPIPPEPGELERLHGCSDSAEEEQSDVVEAALGAFGDDLVVPEDLPLRDHVNRATTPPQRSLSMNP